MNKDSNSHIVCDVGFPSLGIVVVVVVSLLMPLPTYSVGNSLLCVLQKNLLGSSSRQKENDLFPQAAVFGLEKVVICGLCRMICLLAVEEVFSLVILLQLLPLRSIYQLPRRRS